MDARPRRDEAAVLGRWNRSSPSSRNIPVRLENFQGPLDLLLHLIKKHEVNIYDIPISLITSQYLDYLGLMQELDLDVAGEFLVMAATLIHIKSRLLLPRPAPEQEDAEEDPRDALVRRLIEHQKFKAAAEMLHERETVRSAQWTRPDERLAGPRGRGARARARGRSLQPDDGLPRRARAREAAAAGGAARRADLDRDAGSSSCSRGCPRPRPAASRICSTTPRRAPI